MPLVQLHSIGYHSSEDVRFPARNLLRSPSRWVCGREDARRGTAEVVFHLAAPCCLSFLDIGNYSSAMIEISVANSEAESSRYGTVFTDLLPPVIVQDKDMALAGKGRNAVKMLKSDAFYGHVRNTKWDRIQVVCKQPYVRNAPFGLSFIRCFTDTVITSPAANPSPTSSNTLNVEVAKKSSELHLPGDKVARSSPELQNTQNALQKVINSSGQNLTMNRHMQTVLLARSFAKSKALTNHHLVKSTAPTNQLLRQIRPKPPPNQQLSTRSPVSQKPQQFPAANGSANRKLQQVIAANRQSSPQSRLTTSASKQMTSTAKQMTSTSKQMTSTPKQMISTPKQMTSTPKQTAKPSTGFASPTASTVSPVSRRSLLKDSITKDVSSVVGTSSATSKSWMSIVENTPRLVPSSPKGVGIALPVSSNGKQNRNIGGDDLTATAKGTSVSSWNNKSSPSTVKNPANLSTTNRSPCQTGLSDRLPIGMEVVPVTSKTGSLLSAHTTGSSGGANVLIEQSARSQKGNSCGKPQFGEPLSSSDHRSNSTAVEGHPLTVKSEIMGDTPFGVVSSSNDAPIVISDDEDDDVLSDHYEEIDFISSDDELCMSPDPTNDAPIVISDDEDDDVLSDHYEEIDFISSDDELCMSPDPSKSKAPTDWNKVLLDLVKVLTQNKDESDSEDESDSKNESDSKKESNSKNESGSKKESHSKNESDTTGAAKDGSHRSMVSETLPFTQKFVTNISANSDSGIGSDLSGFASGLNSHNNSSVSLANVPPTPSISAEPLPGIAANSRKSTTSVRGGPGRLGMGKPSFSQKSIGDVSSLVQGDSADFPRGQLKSSTAIFPITDGKSCLSSPPPSDSTSNVASVMAINNVSTKKSQILNSPLNNPVSSLKAYPSSEGTGFQLGRSQGNSLSALDQGNSLSALDRVSGPQAQGQKRCFLPAFESENSSNIDNPQGHSPDRFASPECGSSHSKVRRLLSGCDVPEPFTHGTPPKFDIFQEDAPVSTNIPMNIDEDVQLPRYHKLLSSGLFSSDSDSEAECSGDEIVRSGPSTGSKALFNLDSDSDATTLSGSDSDATMLSDSDSDITLFELSDDEPDQVGVNESTSGAEEPPISSKESTQSSTSIATTGMGTHKAAGDNSSRRMQPTLSSRNSEDTSSKAEASTARLPVDTSSKVETSTAKPPIVLFLKTSADGTWAITKTLRGNSPAISTADKATSKVHVELTCVLTKALQPQSDVVQPQSDVVQPRSEVVQPRSEVVQPRSEVVQPQSEVIQPRSEVVQPRSEVVQPRSEVVQPRSEVIQPRSEVVQPRSEDVQPRSEVVQPRSEVVQPRSEVVQPRSEVVQPLVETSNQVLAFTFDSDSDVSLFDLDDDE